MSVNVTDGLDEMDPDVILDELLYDKTNQMESKFPLRHQQYLDLRR